MSVSVDLLIRKALEDDMFSIGTQDPSAIFGHRNIDITDISSAVGISATTGELEITSEGYISADRSATRDWVDLFLVRTPQDIITSRGCGLSNKSNMLTLHIRTLKEKGSYYNAVISHYLEEHFFYNKKLSVPDGGTVSVTKTYQQPTTALESSGRFFNRIFVETDFYYHNDKN